MAVKGKRKKESEKRRGGEAETKNRTGETEKGRRKKHCILSLRFPDSPVPRFFFQRFPDSPYLTDRAHCKVRGKGVRGENFQRW
jgi:hypothetical protein